jgi:hypothetical protein
VRQRAPSPEERQELVEAWVREEIFFREGLAMGSIATIPCAAPDRAEARVHRR